MFTSRNSQNNDIEKPYKTTVVHGLVTNSTNAINSIALNHEPLNVKSNIENFETYDNNENKVR